MESTLYTCKCSAVLKAFPFLFTVWTLISAFELELHTITPVLGGG
jgi:hypothetical protein